MYYHRYKNISLRLLTTKKKKKNNNVVDVNGFFLSGNAIKSGVHYDVKYNDYQPFFMDICNHCSYTLCVSQYLL